MKSLENVLDELVVWGFDDWAMAVDVAFLVKEMLGVEDQDARREPALEVIRMAVEGGWMRLGDVGETGFTPWDLAADAALERVHSSWETLGRPVNLYEVCWLENTEQGNARAWSVLAREENES